MQVQSLLLELQYSKWESSQKNNLFRWARRQRCTERKSVGVTLVRRSSVKRWLSHLYRAVLCLSLANYLFSFSTPDLSWDPPLGVHTPLSQDGSQSEGFWEEQDSLQPGMILWLLSPRILSGHVLLLLLFSLSVMSDCLQPMDCSTPDFPSFTISQIVLKLVFIKSVMTSNHLILCCPLLLPSVFPSIRVFFK